MAAEAAEGLFLPLDPPDPGSLDLEASFDKVVLKAAGGVEGTPAETETGAQVEVRVVRCEDVSLDGAKAVDHDSGAKVWEGGLDLARHLAGPSPPPPLRRGLRVLELGAGHGLPGVVAAMRHGVRVDFHDRSPSILRTVTAPNAAANGLSPSAGAGAAAGSREEPMQAPRFLAGDWRELGEAFRVAAVRYDAVLAAEAIYRVEAYADLAALLDQCLAQDGVALFAGKRFYFGCGGGTASFAAFLRERGFEAVVERVIEDGRSNVREILRITRGGGSEGRTGSCSSPAAGLAPIETTAAAGTAAAPPGGASAECNRERPGDDAGEEGGSKHRKVTHPP